MNQNNPNQNCPVSSALRIIGGKYKSLILWHLLSSKMRFSMLHKLIPEATPKMLTQQLRELEHDGLLIRTVYPEVPPKVEYSLTPKGESIQPVLKEMFAWGAKLLTEEGLTPNCTMVDKTDTCGCQIES